jgi:hypothetical protein
MKESEPEREEVNCLFSSSSEKSDSDESTPTTSKGYKA